MPPSQPTTHIQGDVHCADFIGRDQHVATYGFSAEDVERLIEKMIALLQSQAVFIPQSSSGDAPLSAEHAGERLTFHPGAARRLLKQRSERAYLLGLVIKRDHQIWATKFVPLGGSLDVRRAVQGWDIPVAFSEFRIPPPGSGPEAQITTEPLADITQALERHSAFVILGEPGAGKTTTLQKMAHDSAAARLTTGSGRIPFLVHLSQQGERAPFDFLSAEWQQRTGTDFGDALAAGRVLLLLDGINELPREERPARLKAWRLFAEEYAECDPCVFTSREKDYQSELNLPRVRIEPLDDARIADYLSRNQAEGLAGLLDDPHTRLREMARNPFYLLLLTHAYRSNQPGMANRGWLLQWFVNELFSREERLAHPAWIARAAQSTVLAQMAFQMQEQGESTALPLKAALAILPAVVELDGVNLPAPPTDLIHLARAATLLDPNTVPDVRFYHHLLQEYFAARELLRRFAEGENLSRLWRAKRSVAEMPPANAGEWDALPEPPATGWEVTTLLACGLSGAPEKLIEAVRRVNPALAGRCLAEAGLAPLPALAPVLAATQKDLLADLYDPKMHLRARLQAGFALGKIGDPRFPVREIGGVRVILPEVVAVPGGRYLIGSVQNDPDAFDREKPQTQIEINDFSIGKWPVTNAEFACFIQAGGYQNDQYWHGEIAKRWRDGEDVAGGQTKAFLDGRKVLLNTPRWQERAKDTWLPQDIEIWEYATTLSEKDALFWYSKFMFNKPRTQPAYWENIEYNNPSQPVIGVTWFEAGAYCAWFAQVAECECRLPSEIEWEASARGKNASRVYPWGKKWDAAKANTFEGRVFKSSPVGIYTAVGGVGSFGVEDQAGNVWNWTSSLYLPYPYNPIKSELPEAEGERVLRGGSWNDSRRNARCADRIGDVPDFFLTNLGFRVIFPCVC
jgi:formylglycine-generating enzyme required for sulfatase activity